MRHLFVCTNTNASGKPACGNRGNVELLARVQQLLVARRATYPKALMIPYQKGER